MVKVMSEQDKDQRAPSDDEAPSTASEKTDPWTEEAPSSPEKAVASAEQRAGENAPVEKPEAMSDSQWQRELINRLTFASLNEQRRSRRWSTFFKGLAFIYLFTLLYLFYPAERVDISLGEHTAVVELSGVIMEDAPGSADIINAGLRAAFKDKNTKGVILRVNSPGGSPVQAAYINDEIKRLREKHPSVPIYVVVTELCASAAYYASVAADEIYANKGSLVGSIGVLMDGFGFVDSMKKLGVERRLLTAGENKAFLDPFSPLQQRHKEHMSGLLKEVHQQFIDVVKEGRGDRLADDKDIYTGLVWSGERSVGLGLIDGLASLEEVAREKIGADKIVDFTPRPNPLDRFVDRIGVSGAQTILNRLYELNLR